MEAYLKWRAENPDEGDANVAQKTKENDPGAELPEEDDEDEDGDDYDDEDD